MHSARKLDIDRARRLRTAMTDAEHRLWNHLRGKQLGGLRFRRQYPIGRYVVDFVCLDGRLVIELDGGQHAEAIEKDERRSAELRALGFTVVRFWDNDVLERTEQVVETIRMTLGREGITAGRR